jgi:hypothetical protein
MRRTEHLVNNRASIIDLSPLTDVEGKRLVFQPQQTKGSTREVFREVVEHPHVRRFLDAGWLRRDAAAAVAAPPPVSGSEERGETVPRVVEPDQLEPIAEPRTIVVEIEPSPETAPVPALIESTVATTPPANEAVTLSTTAGEAPTDTKPAVEESSQQAAVPEGRGRKRR